MEQNVKQPAKVTAPKAKPKQEPAAEPLSILQLSYQLYKRILEEENTGSIKARTLKAWLIQTFGGNCLQTLSQIERGVTPENVFATKGAADNTRTLRRFVHPMQGKPPAPAQPARAGRQAKEQEPGTSAAQTLAASNPTSQTTKPPAKEKGAAAPENQPEVPIALSPTDKESIGAQSSSVVLKKYSGHAIRTYLEGKGQKVRDGASDRQLAAMLIDYCRKNSD